MGKEKRGQTHNGRKAQSGQKDTAGQKCSLHKQRNWTQRQTRTYTKWREQKCEWVQSDSQRERKSRINKVIEWAQTPTRVDSNTLKVGTNNTNRDTNRVALESLPWSSLTLFLFVEFTVSLEASNQSSCCFTFLQSTCDVTFLQSFQSGIIRWTLVSTHSLQD